MLRLREKIDAGLESLWLTPLLMLTVSQALALPAMYFDLSPSELTAGLGLTGAAARLAEWEGAVSLSAARGLLSMIAGGMVTVVSIVFSVSFVALTLTSQQIGPRVIDFWLRENVTQALLGLSLSSFFAALSGLLLLLRDDAAGAAALVACALASILAGLTLASIVLFANRMSAMIRADEAVSRVGALFVAALNHDPTPRASPGDAEDARALDEAARMNGRKVTAKASGYLAAIDLDALAAWARREGLRVAILARENEHVTPGRPLAWVLEDGSKDDEDQDEDEGDEADKARSEQEEVDRLEKALRSHLALTARRRRTGVADFEGDALKEIALRALSPGINDPATAQACINRIIEGCALLTRRGPPSRLRRDEPEEEPEDGAETGTEAERGETRIAAAACGMSWMAPRLLNPLIAASLTQAIVLATLAQGLQALARIASNHEDKTAAETLLARLARAAEALPDPDDRAMVEHELEEAPRGT